MEKGAQDGFDEHRPVPHVAVWSPLRPIRHPPVTVRASVRIGRVAQFFEYWLETQPALSI